MRVSGSEKCFCSQIYFAGWGGVEEGIGSIVKDIID